jgi:hypothetical protein
MKPVFAIISRHDRAACTTKMFCDGAPPCAESGYADYDNDEIHDISGVPNDCAARIIADAGVDILIDLNGYSAPERLPMLMQRPAKTQIGWFNMFATTGMDAFDYLVGDDTVIRPEEEKFVTERIFRVPGSYRLRRALQGARHRAAAEPCRGWPDHLRLLRLAVQIDRRGARRLVRHPARRAQRAPLRQERRFGRCPHPERLSVSPGRPRSSRRCTEAVFASLSICGACQFRFTVPALVIAAINSAIVSHLDGPIRTWSLRSRIGQR